MDKIAGVSHLAIAERIDPAAGKDDAVAFFKRRYVNTELARHRERFVPGVSFGRAVGLVVRRLLLKRQRLIPLAFVPFVHCREYLFAGLVLSKSGRHSNYQKNEDKFCRFHAVFNAKEPKKVSRLILWDFNAPTYILKVEETLKHFL